MDYLAVSFVVDIAGGSALTFASLPQMSWLSYQTAAYCIHIPNDKNTKLFWRKKKKKLIKIYYAYKKQK